MKLLLLVTFLTFVGLALVVWAPSSKEHWERIGPKWHCAFNPDTSEYCVK